MIRMRRIYLVAKMMAFSAIFWAGLAATALAKKKVTPVKEESGSFLMSYALVVLVVCLGMLVVCKSSQRRERDKPELYDDKKKLLDD